MEKYEELKKQKDQAYHERNQLVSALSRLYPSCLGRHDWQDATWEKDWMNIVYIDIPVTKIMKAMPGCPEHVQTMQLSWHIHDSDLPMFEHLDFKRVKWDGHTTEEKYRRLACINVPRKKFLGIF